MEGYGSEVLAAAEHILDSPGSIMIRDIKDIENSVKGMDVVKSIKFECNGHEISQVASKAMDSITDTKDFDLKNLLIFIGQCGVHDLKIYEIQGIVNSIPNDVCVLWGIDINKPALKDSSEKKEQLCYLLYRRL